MKTWLPATHVFAQANLAHADDETLAQSIGLAAVQLALRHDMSPAEVLAHFAGQAHSGPQWRPVRDELRRVLRTLTGGQG